MLFIVFTLLNSFKYNKGLNSSIWPIVEILTCTTTPAQSGSESNGNERILDIPKASKLEPHD